MKDITEQDYIVNVLSDGYWRLLVLSLTYNYNTTNVSYSCDLKDFYSLHNDNEIKPNVFHLIRMPNDEFMRDGVTTVACGKIHKHKEYEYEYKYGISRQLNLKNIDYTVDVSNRFLMCIDCMNICEYYFKHKYWPFNASIRTNIRKNRIAKDSKTLLVKLIKPRTKCILYGY